MGNYDYTYEIPKNFVIRVSQLLKQSFFNEQLASAFLNCEYETEDLGNAFYAGIKGDNWNKNAVDFTFEGSQSDIDILRSNQVVLRDALSKGLNSSVSGLQIKNIFYLVNESDIVPATDRDRLNVDINTANAVLKDLVSISSCLINNCNYSAKSSENSINDYFRDMLMGYGYKEVRDQTRHGKSLTEKDAGEVDILIAKYDKEIAIFEGMKLSSVDSSYISNHILKAIINYNALGTSTFIVAYVSNCNFEQFWNRYAEYLKDYKYPIRTKSVLKITTSPNAALRIAHIILSRDGFDFPVYYLAINLN